MLRYSVTISHRFPDTTIISAGTQEYSRKEGFAEIGGCVSTRLKYALVGGIISFFLFWLFGGGGTLSAGGRGRFWPAI